MSEINLTSLWNKTLDLLQNRDIFDETIISTVFAGTRLYHLNTVKALVSVEKMAAFSYLNSQKNKIENVLREVCGISTLSVDFVMKRDLINLSNSTVKPQLSDNLNPEYRFDNFVCGSSNRESYMACLTSANNPKKILYSPLYIYGNSGLGKTHLLHAIGNHIKENSPETRILYMTSDDFITRVVNASRNNTLDELKQEMMSLDVFLLDDIQFLAGGKEKSSETLFNIYNQLYKNKKLIVITSDKRPYEIKELEERLVSRLSNGLTCCIESPESDTAVEILKMKIKQRAEDVSIDDDVLSFLATNYSHDVRALEGSLTRLFFYSLQFGDNSRITLDLAYEAFKEDISKSTRSGLSIQNIQKSVCDFYGITKTQLISKNKTKQIADARAIAIYLCRKHLDVSFSKIGDEFGRRDHSTIMNSCTKIEKNLKSDAALQMAVESIEKTIKA